MRHQSRTPCRPRPRLHVHRLPHGPGPAAASPAAAASLVHPAAPPGVRSATARRRSSAFWSQAPQSPLPGSQRIVRIPLPGGAALDVPEQLLATEQLPLLETALAPLRAHLASRQA